MQNVTPNRSESSPLTDLIILSKLKNLHCVHITLQFQAPEINILVILV